MDRAGFKFPQSTAQFAYISDQIFSRRENIQKYYSSDIFFFKAAKYNNIFFFRNFLEWQSRNYNTSSLKPQLMPQFAKGYVCQTGHRKILAQVEYERNSSLQVSLTVFAKEYFPNLLLVNTFWGKLFVFQIRDLKFWLLAYF